MALIWRKEMSVGNDNIDYDHKYLILYVNTVELCLQTPEQKEQLYDAFEQLYEYAEKHFSREESIQRKIGYPDRLNHRHIHNTLLKELREVELKVSRAKDSEEVKRIAPELTQFLRSWLIDHVFNEDMLLKPYLRKHPRAFS